MNWKKLSAFAPMLAVIVLAGCMGKTLAGYTPATYEAKAEEITPGRNNTKHRRKRTANVQNKEKNKESHKNRKQKESGKRKL